MNTIIQAISSPIEYYLISLNIIKRIIIANLQIIPINISISNLEFSAIHRNREKNPSVKSIIFFNSIKINKFNIKTN